MNSVPTLLLWFGSFPSLGQVPKTQTAICVGFELLCSRLASVSMPLDVLMWMLFPFSLNGKAEQWYMPAAGYANGS
jgi:hypothetical protein